MEIDKMVRYKNDMEPFALADGCSGPVKKNGEIIEEYGYGPDEIVFESGKIYCDSGNGSMHYSGKALNVDMWDFDRLGKIVWDGSNWYLISVRQCPKCGHEGIEGFCEKCEIPMEEVAPYFPEWED